MASKLRIHPLVAQDLAPAVDWYDSISIGLGNRFRAAVTEALKDVQRSPHRYPRAFDDAELRYRRVLKFPYVVLYMIESKCVQIRGVVHTSSDPEKWRSRII